jgi:hypothetical protein
MTTLVTISRYDGVKDGHLTSHFIGEGGSRINDFHQIWNSFLMKG